MDIRALLDKLGLSYLAEPLLLQVLLAVLTTVLANFFWGLTISYAFTRNKEWINFNEVKQDVLLKIAGIIDRQCAHISFSTHTVCIESDAPPVK